MITPLDLDQVTFLASIQCPVVLKLNQFQDLIDIYKAKNLIKIDVKKTVENKVTSYLALGDIQFCFEEESQLLGKTKIHTIKATEYLIGNYVDAIKSELAYLGYKEERLQISGDDLFDD
jgi:hypothetical protein